MSLTRQTQKVFGSNADANQIAAFGTMKTGTPVYSTNLSTLQTQEYTEGWAEAILNDKAPFLEEMNAVQYGLSYQIAYLLQEGIPEYDANTEYSNTSIVKSITGTQLILYVSLQNGNIGHSLTDTDWWAQVTFVGSSPVGAPQITFNFNATLPDNCIWLEGQAISRTTYSTLFGIYGTTYGEGDGSTTFNLPDCRNKVFWGSETAGYIAAGLPNITGDVPIGDATWATGAFYYGGQFAGGSDAGGNIDHYAKFDASRSSSVYSNDVTTVQPPAIKVRVYTRYQ